MEKEFGKTHKLWIAAIILGVTGGLSYWLLGGQLLQVLAEVRANPSEGRPVAMGEQPQHEAAPTATATDNRVSVGTEGDNFPQGAGATDLTPPVVPDPIAMRYVKALQEGRCQEVIDLTAWMQERLSRISDRGGDATACAEDRTKLCDGLSNLTPDGNRLRAEGVEDQYVFSKSATIEPQLVDEGRSDLERPAQSRTWFRVTFSDRDKALRDEVGVPIRSVLAGVNVSTDQMVLKASVTGNLEIDLESISYNWNGIQ